MKHLYVESLLDVDSEEWEKMSGEYNDDEGNDEYAVYQLPLLRGTVTQVWDRDQHCWVFVD